MTLAKSPSVLFVFTLPPLPSLVAILCFCQYTLFLLSFLYPPSSFSFPLAVSFRCARFISPASRSMILQLPSDLFELTFHHESANKFREPLLPVRPGQGSKSPDKRNRPPSWLSLKNLCDFERPLTSFVSVDS